ncbi:hypothetical protein L3073_12920 [Ancylomarina sp. DW003]|nr:hypothetical protein [Ancylomarina sp. DW003]MDE5423114.1 hypothetical protein [Ancylomarina sp. DW003]
MKKYVYTNSILIVLACLILSACEGTFIPDPIDPRLPKYTENGYGTAGAFINDRIWTSHVNYGFLTSSDKPMIKVWHEQDSLRFTFSGSIEQTSASVEFHLTGLGITKFEDLIDLNEQKISLNGNKNIGYYIENYSSSSYDKKGIGQIYFRNVQYNNDKSAIIISGTFGFSLPDTHQIPLKVNSGRFDYKIFKTNFEQHDEYE